jgi:hypothetical protein
VPSCQYLINTCNSTCDRPLVTSSSHSRFTNPCLLHYHSYKFAESRAPASPPSPSLLFYFSLYPVIAVPPTHYVAILQLSSLQPLGSAHPKATLVAATSKSDLYCTAATPRLRPKQASPPRCFPCRQAQQTTHAPTRPIRSCARIRPCRRDSSRKCRPPQRERFHQMPQSSLRLDLSTLPRGHRV